MGVQILLAEGRKLFREGLSLLLEQHAGVKVVADAEDIRDVPRLLRAMEVDIVIWSVSAANRSAADAIRSMLRSRNGVRVVVLAASPAMDFVQALLDAGVSACLTRECATEELVAAVRCVRDKGVYLSPSLVQKVVSHFVCPTLPGGRSTLSPREKQVLEMIAAGQSTKQIACSLTVSTKTVETLRRRLMHKLNRHSVAELTKYAVIEGISPLEHSA